MIKTYRRSEVYKMTLKQQSFMWRHSQLQWILSRCDGCHRIMPMEFAGEQLCVGGCCCLTDNYFKWCFFWSLERVLLCEMDGFYDWPGSRPSQRLDRTKFVSQSWSQLSRPWVMEPRHGRARAWPKWS